MLVFIAIATIWRRAEHSRTENPDSAFDDGKIEIDVVVKLAVDLNGDGLVEFQPYMFDSLKSGEVLLEDFAFHEFDESPGNFAFFEFARDDEIEFAVVYFRFGAHSYAAAEPLSVTHAGDESLFFFALFRVVSYYVKLVKNEFVSMSILDKICKTLGTDYGDIMEYMPENEK